MRASGIRNRLPLIVMAGSLMMCSGCSSRKPAAAGDNAPGLQSFGLDRGAIIQSEKRFEKNIVRDGGAPAAGGMSASAPVQAMAKAVVYRMSGDYAGNVAIALTADGKVLSYPDPSDLTPESAPVSLGDGWWLTRCGITPTSVFTRYTYASYMALPSAPSPAELLEAVIPDARVTECRALQMTTAEALADTAAVKAQLSFTYTPR